ncbi:MAG: FAD-dependent oxidoreductase, partial [Gemmatimonadales bacterium]
MERTEAARQGREATRVDLPVAVIGAGPVGLVAAAHLACRGEAVVLLEAGAAVGASVREWGHVRLFTPWKYLLDPAAEALLAPTGWTVPGLDEHPTGAEYVEHFLVPLSRTPRIAAALRVRSRVVRVARAAAVPGIAFRLDLEGGERVLARAVIDASGNWTTPNPLGGRGEPVHGEEADARIVRGIPDVAGADRSLVAGQRVLVAGSGHSALHLLRELLRVQAAEPATQVRWIIRRPASRRIFGGGAADALPARGAMGQAIEAAVEAGRIILVDDFRASMLRPADSADSGGAGAPQAGLLVDEEGPAGRTLGPFDRILVATGFRPDLGP